MSGFFNLDNKFFQGLNKVVDCVALSTLWLLCCIPVFTAGAATTALYYTINKVIRHGRGYVWKEFWHAFRSNFKQSTVIWLVLVVAAAILGVDGYIMLQFAKAGEKTGTLYVVFFVFLALETAWGIYIFPYIARFENKTKAVFKNTALISIGNLLYTLLLLAIYVIAWLAVYLLPFLVFAVPALYMLIANYILEKIFRKYMSEEDIAAEEERNRDFYN